MKNIILIEDDDTLREGLALLLKTLKYHVHAFADGDSFRRAKNLYANIYLIDYRLPGTDGLTITQSIRQNETDTHVPIIILSASGDNLPSRAKDAGADAFLRKPFEIDELSSRIQLLLTNP